MSEGTRARRGLIAAAVAALSLSPAACTSLTGTTVPSGPPYHVGNIVDGVAAYVGAPTSDPPGVNIWTCKVSAAHPQPVVLVHGTMANAAFTWQALGPMLANAGYCVYELNYGAMSPFSPPIYGLDDIATKSAPQLASFVDKVLVSSGGTKVDIVGHSQGGMMPRYYIQNLGGASKVAVMVGLAPSNQGSDFYGLVKLGRDFDALSGIDFIDAVSSQLPGAFADQEAGSPFLTALNAGGGTSPGVQYYNIDSKYDEIVTPYTNAFLAAAPNVHNITIQDDCASDYIEHIGITYDAVTLAIVMNALAGGSLDYKPPCTFVPPVIGSLGNV